MILFLFLFPFHFPLLFLICFHYINASTSFHAFSTFSREADSTIRKGFLDILKLNYLNEDPSSAHTADTLLLLEPIIRLPSDINREILNNHCNFDDLRNACQVSKSFYSFIKRMVARRLVRFHPLLFTKNHSLNLLLFSLLNSHFHPCISINDPSIHDHLQLLCAKYFFNDLKYNSIPKNIHHYFICFLFEFIYKTELETPITPNEFLIQFFSNLRTSHFNFPLTCEYLARLDVFGTEQWKFHLEFLYSKPSVNEIKNKFTLNVTDLDHLFDQSTLQSNPVISGYILEALLPELPANRIRFVLRFFHSIKYFSPKIVDIIAENRTLSVFFLEMRGHIFANFFKCFSVKYQLALSRKLEIGAFDELYIIHLSMGISATNRFDAKDLNDNFWLKMQQVTEKELLFEYISRQVYSLAYMDALSVMLQSSQVDSQFSTYLFNQICKDINEIALQILVKESATPFAGFFLLHDSHFEFKIPIFKFDFNFMRTFFALLKSDDPFILLGFDMEFLLLCKEFIQDKFDLNKSYQFSKDFYFDCWSVGFRLNKLLHKNIYDGVRIFSFKELIIFLDLPGLRGILSSKLEDFQNMNDISNPTEISPASNIPYFIRSPKQPAAVSFMDRVIDYLTQFF
jgi:hypothetical protein